MAGWLACGWVFADDIEPGSLHVKTVTGCDALDLSRLCAADSESVWSHHACVRACVRVCVRVYVHVCVRACVRDGCVRA